MLPLVASVTLAPPAGATFVKATVQLVLEFEERLVVAHCSEDTSTGVVKERLTTFDEPLREAVTIADWSEEI